MEVLIHELVKNVDGEEKVVFESTDRDAVERELDACECEAEHNGSFTYVSYDIRERTVTL